MGRRVEEVSVTRGVRDQLEGIMRCWRYVACADGRRPADLEG